VRAVGSFGDLRMNPIKIGWKSLTAPRHRTRSVEVGDGERKGLPFHMRKLLIFPLEFAAQRHAKATSGGARESVLATVEQALLDLMGKYEDQTSIARLAEQHGIDRRWLRRMALQLVTQLPPTCANSDEGRLGWVAALRAALTSLAVSYGAGVTAAGYFRMPPRREWSQFLQLRAGLAAVTWATIHEAKGSEHHGVCVVVPSGNYTEELIAAWETRTDSEPKRVIYVGVTRAEKLLAIALPAPFVERVAAIMRAGQVPFEIHDLAVAASAGVL
jgi:DNA helicase-2/ATP-dependent DNA helicase PcrA